MKALDVSGLNAKERRAYLIGMWILVVSLASWFGGLWLLARHASGGRGIGDTALTAETLAMVCSIAGGATVLWAKARSIPPLLMLIFVMAGTAMLLAIVVSIVASLVDTGGAP